MESETRSEPGVMGGTTPRSAIRLTRWPLDAGVGHLVLLDHRLTPEHADIVRSLERAERAGFHTVRTSALFGRAADAFAAEGFRVIDTLALLRADGTAARRDTRAHRVRRLPHWGDAAAATIDQLAFGPVWGNDADALGSIRRATPVHRARWVGADPHRFRDRWLRRATPIGVVFAGIGSTDGFIQRLAVHPEHRRRGVADALVGDVLEWMDRRRVDQVLVNTSVTNVAALRLYDRHGFERLDEDLVVTELQLRPPDTGRTDHRVVA